MFPWLGQGPQQGSPFGIDPRVLQILQRRNQQAGGAQPRSFDLGSLGGLFNSGGVQDVLAKFAPFARFSDNQGLSRLWSPQIGQTQTDPLSGWQTTTNAAHSPLGGLLGRIGGLFR